MSARSSERNQMFLFSEDEDRRVSSLLSRLANYDDAIQPIQETDTLPTTGTDKASKSTLQKANLGVLTGVYLPCIQNIFGVIIFIRMTWMTGTAGIPAFFAIVLLCCSVTFCTVFIISYLFITITLISIIYTFSRYLCRRLPQMVLFPPVALIL